MLKISGIGAQLITKGIQDPEALKLEGQELLEKLKGFIPEREELPLFGP